MKKRFKKIYVEITNICNLSCDFCPKTTREYMNMPVDDFRQVIAKIKDYTDLIYLHVKGEPLLHPNLEQLLDICMENSIMVNLTTNGTLLREKLKILKASKCIRQINISIHSVIENKKSIEEIDKYMKDILYSANELQNTCIISYRLWNLSNIKDNLHNEHLLEIIGNEYETAKLYDLAKEKEYIKLKEDVYLNQDKIFSWPNINADEISDKGSCLGLKNQIAILVNGEVVPCCLDENASINLGNIFDSSLYEILNSKRSKKIIEGFNNNKLCEKLCKTCGFRKRFDNK